MIDTQVFFGVRSVSGSCWRFLGELGKKSPNAYHFLGLAGGWEQASRGLVDDGGVHGTEGWWKRRLQNLEKFPKFTSFYPRDWTDSLTWNFGRWDSFSGWNRVVSFGFCESQTSKKYVTSDAKPKLNCGNFWAWLKLTNYMGVNPKIVVPQNGWFTMENRIKMDDLGGLPLFLVQHPYSFFSSQSSCFFFHLGGLRTSYFYIHSL